jgi:hypothetical protein
MLLYVSAVMLAVGVFLPITSMAVVGDVSYNRIAEIESYIVILLAISGPAFLFIKQHKFILASVIGVWVTLLFPALEGLFQKTDTSLMGKISSKASGAMQEFASELFLNVFQFSWGGYIFLIGLLLFTAVGILRSMKKK